MHQSFFHNITITYNALSRCVTNCGENTMRNMQNETHNTENKSVFISVNYNISLYTCTKTAVCKILLYSHAY